MKLLAFALFLLGLTAIAFTVPRQSSEPEEVAREHQTIERETASPLDTVSLSLSPASVFQGEPVLLSIKGPINSAALSSLTFDGLMLDVFENNGRLSALVGIDLHKKPGSYPVVLILADGRAIKENLEIKERVMPAEEFDIPERMGGNTREGEQKLASNWQADTVILNKITDQVTPEKFWEGPFRFPRDEPIVVTDTYGYSRQTGSVNLSHNGTDFRAAAGTPVYAMNRGKAVFNGTFRNYGHTVIIDHGLGLMTMYMHLSEVLVNQDQKIEKGDLIAKSGNSGYSLAPHLHLSVRINGFSIDPERFLELLGPKESVP